jgi:hypothetical protein
MKPDLRLSLGRRVHGVVAVRRAAFIRAIRTSFKPSMTVNSPARWAVTGTVLAVIIRHDDKLVVARDDTHWTDEEIINATRFQERYFQAALAR